MSLLSEYPVDFIDDMPFIKTPKIRVGKDSKMSKASKGESTPAKTYNKTKGEHFKDMVIVALVVGIIAFGLGFKFNADRNSEMQNAVKAATAQTVAPATDTAKK